MKTTRKLTSLLLIVCITFISMTAFSSEYKQRFWDLPKTHWAFEYVSDLVYRGVLSGYEDGSFKPEVTVTRAEWAKMMCVASNLKAVDSTIYFSDTYGHWANNYVNAAKEYITCYNNNSFRPDQAIVREDVTRSLVALRGYDTSDVDYSYIMEFRDFDSISNDMKAYVAVAVEKGLISGFEDSTFRGQATLTRAEAAALLYRAFQKGDASKTDTMPKNPCEIPSLSQDNIKEDIEDSDGIKSSETGKNLGDIIREESNKFETVNFVAEADASIGDHVSTDGDDTVYYMKDNKVYATNVSTNKTRCMMNMSELEVNTKYAYKTEFKVYSICYDCYTGGILVSGYYDVVNSAIDITHEYIYSVTEAGVEILSEQIPEGLNYIFNVLENGDIVSEDSVWDRKTLERKYNYVSYVKGEFGRALWGYCCSVVEGAEGISFVGVYEADADTDWKQSEIWLGEYVSDKTNTLWQISGRAFGISSEYVVVLKDNCFDIYTKMGKLVNKIELQQNVSDVLKRLIVTQNHIIYYDATKGALNKIAL